jgi:hypothetical protein
VIAIERASCDHRTSGGIMATIELHEDEDGYLYCPRRGEIDVQWCLGCSRRMKVTYENGRAVVVCDPATHVVHEQAGGPLAEVPEPFKLY